MNLYHFFLTSIIIILLPGTGVIYTISVGLSSGKRQSIYAALGCTLGILPHLFVSIMLSSLLRSINATAFFALKMAGSAYLLYLGGGMLLSKESVSLTSEDKKEQFHPILKRGILINLLNPKLTLFFFAFLPQYVSSTNGSYLLQSWLYGVAFMLMTLIIFACYGLFAGMLQKQMLQDSHHMILLQRCFGLVFIVFALQLLLNSHIQ